MYYQVSLFKKNPNEKELIMKKTGEALDVRIEKAKAFLFPDIKSENLYAIAVKSPITVNVRTKVEYERIIVGIKESHPVEDADGIILDGCREYVIKADSKEEAVNEQRLRIEGLLDEGEDAQDFEIYANEISVGELVAEKEESFKRKLLKRYIERRYDYDSLTIKEYVQLCRKLDYKNKEVYIEMLDEEMRISNIKGLLRRKINPEHISLKDYNEAVRRLYAAKDNTEAEKVLAEYVEK